MREHPILRHGPVALVVTLIFSMGFAVGYVGGAARVYHDGPVKATEPAAIVEPAPVEAPQPKLTPLVLTCVQPGPAPEPVTAEPEPTYTEEELDALALAIYQEAGSDACSDEARQMVGEVVLNRVADSRFPATLSDVLTQKAQYGRLYWTGLVWPERASTPEEAHAVERARACAKALLEGTVDRLLPEDTVWQAEFIQGTEVVSRGGGFYFCR